MVSVEIEEETEELESVELDDRGTGGSRVKKSVGEDEELLLLYEIELLLRFDSVDDKGLLNLEAKNRHLLALFNRLFKQRL